MTFDQLPADIQTSLNMDALYLGQIDSNINVPIPSIVKGSVVRVSLKSPALAQSLMAHQGFMLISAAAWFNDEAAPSTDEQGLDIAKNAIAATQAGA